MSKRWRTRLQPSFVQQSHPSKVAAYRYVQARREDRRMNLTRARIVAVFVSDDHGPWELYERVDLGEPEVDYAVASDD